MVGVSKAKRKGAHHNGPSNVSDIGVPLLLHRGPFGSKGDWDEEKESAQEEMARFFSLPIVHRALTIFQS